MLPLRFTLALSLVLVVFGRTDADEIIRLGSWNIQRLGEDGRVPAQEPTDLAKYIDFSKVDILALQEIRPTGPAPAGFDATFETSKALDKTFDELNKLQDGQWKHILFPAFFVHPTEGKKQWVGVAWNEKKVQPVKTPVKIPVSNEDFKTGDVTDSLWKRSAHAMMFTAGVGKTDFVLIPVHMKSNLGGNFRAHREAEAKELIKQLPALDKALPGEKDIIILGDTNFLLDENGFKEAARDVFAAAKFKDLNIDNVGTHLPGNKAPFDRFLVPDKQPEFQLSSQKVLRDFLKQEGLTQKAFTTRFSDHLRFDDRQARVRSPSSCRVVAGGNDDVESPVCQLSRCLKTDATVGTRDEHNALSLVRAHGRTSWTREAGGACRCHHSTNLDFRHSTG